MNISPTVTKRRFARLPPVVTNGLVRGGLVVLLVVAASYAGWVLATAKATDDVVTKGLGAARALLQGSTVVQQVPVTPEGYAEVAKFRQEVFCKDSGSMDIKPQGRITILKDPYNTTVLQIHPLPAYMCVYGGAQDIVSQAIIAGHVWESHDLDEISWALQVPLPEGAAPTSTIGPALVVDIGANLGAFTFNLAAQGYEVIAFEGMNANQRMMRTCLCASHPSIMSRVTLHAMGLGARKSTCYLIAANDNRGDGIALCNAKDEQDALKQIGNPSYALRGTMDIEKLDNVLKRDVKVMKIDVEGFEPFVMAGAERLLTDHTVWFLVVEYNKVLLSNSLKGQTEIQRVDFVLRLARLGYRISSKSFKGPFMTEEQIVDMDHMVGPHLLNLYFVHKRVALPHS